MAENELKQAIVAIQAGDKKLGKSLLSGIIQQEPENENAWLWLSTCVDTIQEKQKCLQSVLEINPNNQRAKEGVDRLSLTKLQPDLDQIVDNPPDMLNNRLEAKTSKSNKVSMMSNKSHPVESRCIYCDEAISPRAVICPYCCKDQNKNKDARGIIVLILGYVLFAIPFILGDQGPQSALFWFPGGLMVLLSLVSLLTE